MDRKQELITIFMELCRLDSESLAERPVADYILNYLKNLEITGFEDQAGRAVGGNAGNIIFTIPGKLPGTILFSAHMDTVKPGIGVIPVELEDRITSDGTTILGADDKAGLAVLLEAAKIIIKENSDTPSLLFVLTVAEEIGLLGAANLTEKIQAEIGYVLDSSHKPGTVINQAPVHFKYEIQVTGKAAHAGIAPEQGINAIKIAAEIIQSLPTGRMDPETTANVGMIHGGLATNIVPEEAVIHGEVRSYQRSKAELLMESIKATTMEISRKSEGSVEYLSHEEYDCYYLPEDAPVVRRAGRVIQNLDMPFQVVPTGGGSDANVFNHIGIPSVVLGLGYEYVHTKQEEISKEYLTQTLDIVLGLMRGPIL